MLTNPQNGQQKTEMVDGKNFVAVVAQALYTREYFSAIPLMVATLEDGVTSVYAPVASLFAFGGSFSRGTYNSIVCSEIAAFGSPEMAAAASASVRPNILSEAEMADIYPTCAAWGVQAAPAIENQPIHSPIPTLLMSGEYDPITPASFAGIAQQTLPNSRNFVFPGLGHGTFGNDACPTSVVAAFLMNPTVAPDASCIASMPAPEFIPSQDGSQDFRRWGAAYCLRYSRCPSPAA
jgi:pimeloyl-ACP methyl ester carboxylesterase